MANILLFTLGRELDANGVTVPGAKATFFEAGTTTPITAYSDAGASIAHPSPLEADAGGLFAPVYVTATTAKVVVTKADGSALRTIDPCPIVSLTGVGASGVSFTPTVDIPETNVQDAIEAAAASAASGFAAYGIGITGNAPDLANLDATNIGTGFYRTTASTTGTFPTGITASSTSLVEMYRETSALGRMVLADDSGRVWRRFMIASAWGAWREIPSWPMASSTGALSVMGASGPTVLTVGSAGQVLMGNTGAVPGFTDKRVYSSAYTTTGGSTADSTGLFPGGANIPSWAKTVGIEFLGVSTAGTQSAPNGVRIGDSVGFLAAGYVSHSSYDGATDYTDTACFAVQGQTSSGESYGRIVLHKLGTGDWTELHTVSLTQRDATTAGGGYILAASLGGKTIDRVRFITTGTTFDVMRIVFWYE